MALHLVHEPVALVNRRPAGGLGLQVGRGHELMLLQHADQLGQGYGPPAG